VKLVLIIIVAYASYVERLSTFLV